jgi:hypothetical protein
MNVTLTLTQEKSRWSSTCQATIPGGWRGTTPALTFRINGKNGDEYPFYGNTRQEVIERVISELKNGGKSGTLRVIG